MKNEMLLFTFDDSNISIHVIELCIMLVCEEIKRNIFCIPIIIIDHGEML